MPSLTPIFLSALLNFAPAIPTTTASIPSPIFTPNLSKQQSTLTAGIYNLGSSYIAIATQGDRTCYEGYSLPSGRYAVAVGETTGSLSPEKDYFVLDGWKQRGKTITLRQNSTNLLITNNDDSPEEYNYFQSISRETYSDALTRCLNSTEPFFETAPGYNISN
jgi:hypothetical protein